MSMRRLFVSNNQRICSSFIQKTRNLSAISSSHPIISPQQNTNPTFSSSSSSLLLKEFRRGFAKAPKTRSLINQEHSKNEKKEGSRTSYISGARLPDDKKVKIALTKIDGIGHKKAIQICCRLGISDNIKMKELTKYQMDQIEQMVSEDHVVHWELKRGERADIERLISISCYRGTRHQDGLPLRGQRTHTNAKTSRKKVKK